MLSQINWKGKNVKLEYGKTQKLTDLLVQLVSTQHETLAFPKRETRN